MLAVGEQFQSETVSLYNIKYFVFNVKLASPETRFQFDHGCCADTTGLRLAADTPKHFMNISCCGKQEQFTFERILQNIRLSCASGDLYLRSLFAYAFRRYYAMIELAFEHA